MKRNKIYFGLLLFILVSITVWSALAMVNAGKEEEPYSVSVIVNDSNSDRWIAMREGLEQAAQDHNIELNYVSTGAIVDIDEEMALISREIERGADGIIAQMIDSNVNSESVEAIDSRVALMLLETDVTPEEVYTYIGPDNLAIGTSIAEAVKEDFGAGLDGKKIGILAGNQDQIAMQQRLEGLEAEFLDTGVELLWTIQGQSTETSADIILKQQTSPADIIVALGNSETEAAVDYLLTLPPEKGEDVCLYGAGCSEKAVYYLDKGVIQTLVVPNEFNMGYQSMAGMAKQLEYRLSEVESQTVNYLVVDRTNLYDEENQKILFPIVQ